MLNCEHYPEDHVKEKAKEIMKTGMEEEWEEYGVLGEHLGMSLLLSTATNAIMQNTKIPDGMTPENIATVLQFQRKSKMMRVMNNLNEAKAMVAKVRVEMSRTPKELSEETLCPVNTMDLYETGVKEKMENGEMTSETLTKMITKFGRRLYPNHKAAVTRGISNKDYEELLTIALTPGALRDALANTGAKFAPLKYWCPATLGMGAKQEKGTVESEPKNSEEGAQRGDQQDQVEGGIDKGGEEDKGEDITEQEREEGKTIVVITGILMMMDPKTYLPIGTLPYNGDRMGKTLEEQMKTAIVLWKDKMVKPFTKVQTKSAGDRMELEMEGDVKDIALTAARVIRENLGKIFGESILTRGIRVLTNEGEQGGGNKEGILGTPTKFTTGNWEDRCTPTPGEKQKEEMTSQMKEMEIKKKLGISLGGESLMEFDNLDDIAKHIPFGENENKDEVDLRKEKGGKNEEEVRVAIKHIKKKEMEELQNPLKEMKVHAQGYAKQIKTEKARMIKAQLPTWLAKTMDKDKARRLFMKIQELDPDDVIEAMEPEKFQKLKEANRTTPNKFKYGNHSHGSNVEFEYRLKIKSIEEFTGLPCTPEDILNEYLPMLHWAVTQNGHTLCIVRKHGDEERSEVGRDGIFPTGDDLSQYCYERRVSVDQGVTEFVIVIRSTYKGIGGIRNIKTMQSSEMGKLKNDMDNMGIKHVQLDGRIEVGETPVVMAVHSYTNDDDITIKQEIVDRVYQQSGVKLDTGTFKIGLAAVTFLKETAMVKTVLAKEEHKEILRRTITSITKDKTTPGAVTEHYEFVSTSKESERERQILKAAIEKHRTLMQDKISIDLTGIPAKADFYRIVPEVTLMKMMKKRTDIQLQG